VTRLRVHDCGPGTSIQDAGRFGWLRYGIASSGAADPLALAAANVLVGNAPAAAAIELTYLGATIEARDGAARLALAGAPMPLRIDGRDIPDHTSFVLQPRQRLRIGTARAGLYAVLAIEGGIDVAPVLGSRSLHRRAAIGGLAGRPVGANYEIPLVQAEPSERADLALPPLPIAELLPLRVVLGPQQEFATARGIATFLEQPFQVTSEVDRMACRLSGPRIELAGGFNIVSDGIIAGAVQVPGSGHPIVMLADRQTTGGYPKIATVISADLRLLAHRRPGDDVRFAFVTIEQAQAIARRRAADVAALALIARPATRALDHSDQLLSLNLAGAGLSASDPATWQT
jgi:5-oxoprolinase (ATP-hydrolysing) subunit C